MVKGMKQDEVREHRIAMEAVVNPCRLSVFVTQDGPRIARYPAPGFFRLLHNNIYQPPDRYGIIPQIGVPSPNHDAEE